MAKTTHPFDKLRKYLEGLTDLPADQWAALQKTLTVERLKKRQFFIQVGDTSERVAYVNQGLLKAYYITHDGKEFIRNFCIENTFVSAYSSLLTGEPSNVSIEALEDSELINVSWTEYNRLLKRHTCWQEIGRRFAETYYMLRERRHYELLSLTAEQRHENFMREFAPILPRLSQQDIATFIGITPVSLSRLKSARIKRKRH